MAERSPRPGSEEDAAEEAEEAAEVEQEEEAADSPPPPPPGAEAPSSAGLPSGSGLNLFANDGSFLELFKKKMEASGSQEEGREPEERKKPDKRTPTSFVGKRRGGAKLALKTGMVTKKPKMEEEILTHKGGAWAQYMAEVKKYKAHQCSDDDKTRPLVK
ncbi:telomerase RNA component interacting RNase [Dendrobates tinctorius]|uniref:telomerase RNA component interacting RNase-like n=1 Tax=Dendrobates tinctorius TaxID=92724 RepID=UPI003CCA22CB